MFNPRHYFSCLLGFFVGSGVGMRVGYVVGLRVTPFKVSLPVSFLVEVAVGLREGLCVGKRVGFLVGNVVGKRECLCVGTGVVGKYNTPTNVFKTCNGAPFPNWSSASRPTQRITPDSSWTQVALRPPLMSTMLV